MSNIFLPSNVCRVYFKVEIVCIFVGVSEPSACIIFIFYVVLSVCGNSPNPFSVTSNVYLSPSLPTLNPVINPKKLS